MKRLLKDRFFWYSVILAIFTGIFVYASDVVTLIGIAPRENWELEYYSVLYRFFFLVSIIVSAWRFGIKGGLVTCLTLGLIILPLFVEKIHQPNAWIDVGLIFAGILFSWLIGRQGEIKRLLAGGGLFSYCILMLWPYDNSLVISFNRSKICVNLSHSSGVRLWPVIRLPFFAKCFNSFIR